MDNVTHTLVGVALGKTRLGEISPLARPALIFAANAPDLDLVVQWFGGRSAYLVHHRGITHSIFGVLVGTALLTLLFGWLDGVWKRRSARLSKPPDLDSSRPEVAAALRPAPSFDGSPTNWSGLAVAMFCALATQPLFDWFNTYGIRPWLPFDHTWYYGDLASIIDPWLWLLIGGGACLAGRRSRWGNAFYALIAIGGFLLILGSNRFGATGARWPILLVWSVGITALAVSRLGGWGRRRPNLVIGCAAVASACYLGFLGWSGAEAWRRFGGDLVRQFPAGESLQRHMWSPEPADPFSWTLIAETEQAVYRLRVSLLGSDGSIQRYPSRIEDPAVQEALQTPEGRAWAYFARFPIAEIIHESPAREVLLLDARYPVEPPERNWCRMRIALTP